MCKPAVNPDVEHRPSGLFWRRILSEHCPPYASSMSDPISRHHLVVRQLPVSVLKALIEELGLSVKSIAELIYLHPRTLRRRLDEDFLPLHLSDITMRMLEVYANALDAFETPERARTWLVRPLPALNGKSPLELVRTSAGTNAVIAELARYCYQIPE